MFSPMKCEPGSKFSFESEASSESESKMKPLEPSTSLPKEVYIFRHDVVRCSKYEEMLGLVLEVAGDSDSEGSGTDESDIESDKEYKDSSDKDDDNYSDYDNDNDDSDGDNDDDGESSVSNVSLSDGQVRVVWTDGSETTNNRSDITVVDREFLHGDIVASVSDPMGQLGRVVDVNVLVDLRASSGETLKNVSSRNLKRVRDFTTGDYVVYGPWLGRVDEVLDSVTMLFDDGSVCKVIKADPLRLKPVSKGMVSDSDFAYYPGQRVRAVSSSVFKTSRWLSGLWKAGRVEGTVTKVQAASVFVYWISSVGAGIDNNSETVPSEEQNPKDLTLLSYFAHSNWQLGDWCLFPTPQALPSSSAETSTAKDIEDEAGQPCSDEASQNEQSESHHMAPIDSPNHLVSGYSENGCSADSIIIENLNEKFSSPGNELLMSSKGASNCGATRVAGTINAVVESSSLSDSAAATTKEQPQSSWPAYSKKLRKLLFKREKKVHKREAAFERAFFVASTMRKVDVAWQDGSREFGVDSKSLIPVQSPGDHDFFPEQYVVGKTSNDVDDPSEVKHVGVVRSVDAKERTACMRWLKPVSRPEDPQEFDSEEVVSAYELAEHPDYDYCYGDLVVRLSPFSASKDAPISEDSLEQEDYTDLPQENDEMNQVNPRNKLTQRARHESYLNFSSLSWVGHITGLLDGDIEVTWADGMISKVGPQAIYVVGQDDDEESFDSGSDASDDGASWETVEESGMAIFAATDEMQFLSEFLRIEWIC